ncbi:MAG: aminoglycoside 3'-phosphotransferase [Firmicutes bacterium]|nr:aminoglycoside 3'-phosphotransferase [Bacillota bacterium]
MIHELPASILKFTQSKPYTADDTGFSGSEIRIYDDYVLKIEKISDQSRGHAEMLRFLEGKLPAPKLLAYEEKDGFQYLLMSRITGEMTCSKELMDRSDELLKLIADGLKMLWQVDISECPRYLGPDHMLPRARDYIERGLFDPSGCDPETFGPGGFESPKALLEWLETHIPPMDPVFSHGDYCMPNVMIEDGKISGFIDLGMSGVADRYVDIALMHRSLTYNYGGWYGGKVYPDFNADRLFDYLGIEPDWEKLRYYKLLDELF